MDRKSWQKTVLGWLMISFVCILSPIYLLSVIMYNTGFNTLRGEISASMEAQVSFYMDSLENEVKRIRLLQYDLVNDRDINQLASIPESLDNIGTVFGLLRIQNRMLAIKESSKYIREATVFIPASNKQVTPSSIAELDAAAFDTLLSIDAGTERKIAYHEQRMLLMTQYPPTYLAGAKRARFLIAIELSVDEFTRALGSMCGDAGSGVVLAERNGRRVAWAGSSRIRDSLAWERLLGGALMEDEAARVATIGAERYLRVVKASEYLDAALCKFIPESLVFKSITGYRGWFIVFVCAALLIILIYSVNIYQFIHKPLGRLADSFKHVERGDFDIHIDHARDDEFRYIYRQFNGMVANLKTLIDQACNQKILVQRAEMRQLQSQIDPHFMFNSFFILNTMVRTGDYGSLENFTSQLGRYFRFITKNASDTVSLAEETSHARIYAEIQAMRFSNRVELRFEALPEEYGGAMVPRLILQPIIENAFEHGLGASPDRGLLAVRFRREGESLLIDIENGGQDLGEDRLREFQGMLIDPSMDGEISALQNIHQRLLLKFGPDSGLSLQRGSSGGLRVRVRIDLRERE